MAAAPGAAAEPAGRRAQPQLILASTSSARRKLMDALGISYRAVAPEFDERSVQLADPTGLARALALAKARAVATKFPDAWVIGADQVCTLDGEILHKPRELEDARRTLEGLRGRTHQLITGVALLGPQLERLEHDAVSLTMYPLSDAEREAYLATREWEGCAGGYQVEHRGMALFREIDGDFTSVQGLPMLLLVRLLRDAGYGFTYSTIP